MGAMKALAMQLEESGIANWWDYAVSGEQRVPLKRINERLPRLSKPPKSTKKKPAKRARWKRTRNNMTAVHLPSIITAKQFNIDVFGYD